MKPKSTYKPKKKKKVDPINKEDYIRGRCSKEFKIKLRVHCLQNSLNTEDFVRQAVEEKLNRLGVK